MAILPSVQVKQNLSSSIAWKPSTYSKIVSNFLTFHCRRYVDWDISLHRPVYSSDTCHDASRKYPKLRVVSKCLSPKGIAIWKQRHMGCYGMFTLSLHCNVHTNTSRIAAKCNSPRFELTAKDCMISSAVPSLRKLMVSHRDWSSSKTTQSTNMKLAKASCTLKSKTIRSRSMFRETKINRTSASDTPCLDD